MAFMRAATASSFRSRAWSTAELADGLSQILQDGQLPDDPNQLKELEDALADMERQQESDSARHAVKTVATPQNNQKPVGPEEPANQETQPATESQLLQYQRTMKVASSPARSRVTAKSSSGEGASSPPAYDTLVNLFKDGKLDATTAMKMMAGISESATPKTPTSETSSVPKASQGSNTGFRKKRSHEEDQSDDDAASDDMELEGSKYSRLDQKTKASLKAKLRRLCELKAGGRLQVPTWLHEQWKKGDHLAMALKYQSAGFNKDEFVKTLEKTYTEVERKKNKVSVGWYSESDMLTELKWKKKKIDGAIALCMQDELNLVRTCKYGGETEYWVETRECGEKENETENKRQRKEVSEDKSTKPMGDVDVSELNKMDARAKAVAAAGTATAQACRGKHVLTKFCDSVLTKSAKIRSLINDLRKNYEDETADRSIGALEGDLNTLEKKYNMLSEHLAKGETVDFNKEWTTESERLMKQSTVECTKVAQNEAKIRNAKRHFQKKDKKVKDEEENP